MPGSKGGKPDKDELEMMKDIMGGDMMSDTTESNAKVSKKKKKIVINTSSKLAEKH